METSTPFRYESRFGHPKPTPHSMGYINLRQGEIPILLQEFLCILAVTKYPGQVLLEYIIIIIIIMFVCTHIDL